MRLCASVVEEIGRFTWKGSDAMVPAWWGGKKTVMGKALRWRGWLLLILAGVAGLLLAWPVPTAHAGAFEEGVNFFQGGHYRWALEKFIEAVDQAPRDPERQWYLAESYRLLADNAAAGQAYRRILQLTPQSHQAMAARRALDTLGEPSLTTFQIPFQKQGASVLLPGKLNGQLIGYFILDTGATFTSVSRSVADRLGVASGGSTVRLGTASGAIQVPLALLDEVEVGGAVARHVAAVIHDLPNVPPNVVGLLGLSFLERFRVNLDLTSGVLVLESGD
jgi:clan AA aspartic protease (TIGR02281 family)